MATTPPLPAILEALAIPQPPPLILEVKLPAMKVAMQPPAMQLPEAIANRTETEHLVVSWMTWSGSPTDLQMVVDEMNALTVPELNIEIEMQVTDYASRNQTLTLQLTGGEQIDIMSCLGMTFSSAVQNDYLIDLEENDLIQTYGQDIIETMGQEFVDTCRIGGVLYGTPNQRDMAQGKSALCIRTDILVDACEAAGITPDLENETWYTDEDTVWENPQGS